MAVIVSVVMPCLNESETLGICINKAKSTLKKLNIESEIVVADNGSTDNSVEIAESLGARVVHQPLKGYGNAYRAGIMAAEGKYVIIGDSDDSYDFTDLERFITPLTNGADFVMGSRLKGKIEDGAMPWLHRYIGNPVLTGILNIMYQSGISDAHCGMRSFKKEAFKKMNLQTTGMEFASEMVIKAAQLKLKTVESPITLHKDGRTRSPHLRSFRDGWRHLRFMLLHSPTHLYLWPGLTMFILGLIVMFTLLPGPLKVGNREFDMHVMVFGSLLTVLGFQVISVGMFARIYAVTHDFVPYNEKIHHAFQLFNLERGLVAGAILFLMGFILDFYILVKWIMNSFGELAEVRPAIVASTLIIIGTQIIFSSFFLSMLGIERRNPNDAKN